MTTPDLLDRIDAQLAATADKPWESLIAKHAGRLDEHELHDDPRFDLYEGDDE